MGELRVELIYGTGQPAILSKLLIWWVKKRFTLHFLFDAEV